MSTALDEHLSRAKDNSRTRHTMSWINPLSADEAATLIPDVLLRPEAEGARVVALQWLHQLIAARARWHSLMEAASGVFESERLEGVSNHVQARSEELAETVHKARVALRRLRAVIREHRKLLKVGNRRRQALRSIGLATNSVRDDDVQLAWLDAEVEGLSPDAREEAVVMRQLILEGSAGNTAVVESAFTDFFDPHVHALTKRLSWYAGRQRVGTGTLPQPPYSAAVADRLARGSERIYADIERINRVRHPARDTATQARLHDIRLHLKRHRALLATISTQHPSLSRLYELLTRGQDLLGAMRDADQLALRAHKARLHALRKALDATKLSNADAFLDQWLSKQQDVQRTYDAAIETLRSMAYDVRVQSSESSTNDLPSGVVTTIPFSAGQGHGLAMEIERKFLLRDVPPLAAAVAPIVIEQGWIPGVMLRERLRRSVYPDGNVRCTRTLKLGRPEERIEVEEDTPQELFDALWPLTVNARIRKHRHVVREGALAWEIDVFLDRQLVLAEVELDSVQSSPPIPEWLAAHIVREVTGEVAYLNSQMARADATGATVQTSRTSA